MELYRRIATRLSEHSVLKGKDSEKLCADFLWNLLKDARKAHIFQPFLKVKKNLLMRFWKPAHSTL